MNRKPESLGRPALLWVLVVGLLASMATPALGAEGDAIYVVMNGFDLVRLGTEEESMEMVAVLDTDLFVRDLVFDRQGRLLGLFEDESIRTIDPETGVTTLLVPGPPDLPNGYSFFRDLAEGSDGWLYLLDSSSQRLKRIDPRTGTSELLRVHPNPDQDPETELFVLGRYQDGLIGMGSTNDPAGDYYPLFTVGEATGSLAAVEGLGYWYGQGMDYDSDGDVWVAEGSGLITPPIFFLTARDFETQEWVGKPVYDFFGHDPPFAVRRGSEQGPETCRPGPTTLCLQEGRFRVEVEWQDATGQTGPGHPVPGASPDASLVWFFSPDNWELSLKILDACILNNHHWFSLAGTTDVGFTVTVTDLRTGVERAYGSPVGQTAETVIDVEAFGCP